VGARLITAAVLLVALVLAAGCGEREQPAASAGAPERLRLLLDFFPNADHAGIYAAEGTGAFRDVRLDVEVQAPPDPSAPLRLLEAGRADLAISYQPEVLLARDRGADVVAIAALVQAPLTSIISIGDRPIRDVRELRDRRIGTAGIPYQDAYLRAILDRAGVPRDSVERVNVGFNLTPAMESGRVDATLGSFWNYEGVQLQRRGRNPTILRVERLGVPTYNELVVVARAGDVRNRGPVLRRFLLALTRGHEALRSDPRTGVEPLLRAGRDLDRGLQEASVRATLPVFFPRDAARPFGYMDPEAWGRYGRWMRDQRLLERAGEDPAARAFTNEFLPGEGLGDPSAAPGS